VSACAPRPRFEPISPASEPVMLAASFAIWPVARSTPVSDVERVNPSRRPEATIGLRESDQPMSMRASASPIGLSRLPERLCGAAASSALPMAASDTATGAITTEVRLADGSGGIALMSGRRGGAGPGGKRVLSAHSVPLKDTATMNAPNMMLRAEKVRCRPLGRIGVILEAGPPCATAVCVPATVCDATTSPKTAPLLLNGERHVAEGEGPRMIGCAKILCAILGAAALMHAPQASAQPAKSNFYVTARSACYATGPQQGRPPETMVPAGAVVRLVPAQPIGIYRRVETKGGTQCWIDGSRLRLLVK
jgi:hypothetical protein